MITTDNAGNTFTSATVTVTVDRTEPLAPSMPFLAAATDSGVAGDNLTNNTTPTLTGTAEAGPTVKLFDGASQVGSGTATGGSSSITTTILLSGAHTLNATATDPAGNASAASAGTTHKADTGDKATITFSERLMASSFCSTWTSNSALQSLGNATVTLADGGKLDSLSITTASCTFHLGTFPIGSYVSASTTFTSSTLTWDPSAKAMTITLGTLAGSATGTAVTATAPKYAPDAALADVAGNAMTATTFTDDVATGF